MLMGIIYVLKKYDIIYNIYNESKKFSIYA